MDWNYFRDDNGGFKLKRLPALKNPLKVKDETDMADYRPDFRGMDFHSGLELYHHLFDSHSYEVEPEEVGDAFNRRSAKDLGELGTFAKHYDVLAELYIDATSNDFNEADDADDAGVRIDGPLRKKALATGLVRELFPETTEEWGNVLSLNKMPELKEMAEAAGVSAKGVRKADLCQRLAEAGEAGEPVVPKPAYPGVKADKRLVERLNDWHAQLLHDLSEALETYPKAYKQAVMEAVYLDDEVVPRQLIRRYSPR